MAEQPQRTLITWINSVVQQPCQFSHFNLIETQEISRMTPEVLACLRTALINAKVNVNAFKLLANKIGWPKVEEKIVGNFLARGIRMRRGFFGEVLICGVLQQFSGYIIPIQKWRYSMTSDQSLPSTDAIAIKLVDGSISELCFVESKLRTTKNKVAAVEGYQQLKNDFLKDMPDMLYFVLCRLEERNDPLFNTFDEYLYDRRNLKIEKFYLGLVWEDSVWSNETLNELDALIPTSDYPSLTVDKIRIQRLAELVTSLYQNTGLTETLDEY